MMAAEPMVEETFKQSRKASDQNRMATEQSRKATNKSRADFDRVGEAIRFLAEHYQEQPVLADVARHVGLSPTHLQRVFSRWVGVSPKRFLQFLTVEHAKRVLAESSDLLETTWETGLSSPGRLHDHFVTVEAVSPGEFMSGELGPIRWGVASSPFGSAFLAASERGIVRLAFLGETPAAELVDELAMTWPGVTVDRDEIFANSLAERVFTGPWTPGEPLTALVKGSNFQLAVWRALLEIPEGRVSTYGSLATALGKPSAARAVGGAVGANSIAYLIPCHRVIRSGGEIGGYRWGAATKHAMLAWESARREKATGISPGR